MMPTRLALAFLAVLLCACEQTSDGAADRGQAPPATAPVVATTVEEREFAQPIEAIGTARSLESVLVTSRVSGRVRQIFFDQGSPVKAEDPLVQLEDDEERAALQSAQSSTDQAETRLKRLQELSGRGLVSKDDFDTQTEVVKSSRAELELARVLLAQRTIRAPFSGVLGFRQVSPGTLVQPGTAIVSLDATQTLRAEFQIPETLLSVLERGNAVTVESAAYRGESFAGEIETIGTRVDEVTRAVTVQALIANPDGKLKPGMLLTVTTQAAPRTTRFVAEAALVPENADQYVWRIDDDNTVERLRIEIGTRTRGFVEVLSGLEAGDRVVVEGQTNLRPGREVREIERSGADRSARSD